MYYSGVLAVTDFSEPKCESFGNSRVLNFQGRGMFVPAQLLSSICSAEASMLALYIVVLLFCGVAILFSIPAIIWYETRRTFSSVRVVRCPESQTDVEVEMDAKKAARTVFSDKQQVEIAWCERWPERKNCPQDCVPQAVAQNTHLTFAINHVGVVFAALLSWAAVGALRASPMTREWLAESGYSRAEFWTRIGLRTPAVLTLLASFVAAYVLVWILRHTKTSGVLHGISAALIVWAATVAVSIPQLMFESGTRVFLLNSFFALLTLVIAGAAVGLFVVPVTVVTGSRRVRVEERELTHVG